jgi:hypothetical protein
MVLVAVALTLACGCASVHAEGAEGQPVVSLSAIVVAHHGSSFKHPGYTSVQPVSTPEAAYWTVNEASAGIHRQWLTEEVEGNFVKTPWSCKRPRQAFHEKLTARGNVGQTVTKTIVFRAQLSARWCVVAQAREVAQRLAAERRHEAEVREAEARRREVESRKAAEHEAEQHEVQSRETSSTCTNGTYVNSAGNTVCKPEESSTGPPAGATAECTDGTYSFSESRSGTCSSHGGVARWL